MGKIQASSGWMRVMKNGNILMTNGNNNNQTDEYRESNISLKLLNELRWERWRAIMLIEIWPHIMRRISINKNNETANKRKIKFMNLHLLWLYLSLYIIMQSPFITYMNSLSFKQLTQFFWIIKSIILLQQQLNFFCSCCFHNFPFLFFDLLSYLLDFCFVENLMFAYDNMFMFMILFLA